MSEGVQFEFNALPLALMHEGRKLVGLEIARTRLVAAGDGRPRPEQIPGSEEVLPATALIFAFGYRPSPPKWLQGIDVGTDDAGLVQMEAPLPGQTSNPAIFAAGDMVRGSDLVVTAIADARLAAESIIQYLDMQKPQLKRA
jgi:glutamate synthase (NADPH/NADH) small chain